MRCTDSLLEDQWMMAFVPEIRLLVMTLGGNNQMYHMYFKTDLRGKSHHIKLLQKAGRMHLIKMGKELLRMVNIKD